MTVLDGNTVKVVAKLTFGGLIDIRNVFYAYLVSGGPADDADVQDDLAAWLEEMYTVLNPYFSMTVRYESIEMFNQDQDQRIGEMPWPTMTVGSAGVADTLPTGTSALLVATTNVLRVLAKKYWPPMIETAQSNGVLVPALLLDLATVGLTWVTPFGSTGTRIWAPTVWRRVLGVSTPLTGYIVRDVVAYQRRRKLGVGS